MCFKCKPILFLNNGKTFFQQSPSDSLLFLKENLYQNFLQYFFLRMTQSIYQ